MKRKALFVGVNEYRDPVIQDLRYAENDAALLFAQFKAIGYDAVLMSSPTRSDVENKVAKMIEDMDDEDDVFLFYFAGHGFVAPGDDERLFCKDDFYHKLQYHSAGLSFAMLRDTTRQGGLNRIFILDACRSNAFSGQRGGGRPRDLVPMSKMMGKSAVRDVRCHGGHAIWRSCSSGQCAMELEPYEHGVFSLAIDKVMSECLRGGRELVFDKPFMRLVVNKMQEFSHDEQMPEDQYSGNWPGIVLIQGGGSLTYSQNVTKITSQPVVICPVCGRHNQIADTFRCRVCGKDYLCERHYDESANCCADCAARARAYMKPAESGHFAVLPKTGDSMTLVLPSGVRMEMIYCAPGSFTMGGEWEKPVHTVILTKGFWLGKYPVTQIQWESVMGNNPSRFKGATRPVEHVSWDMCQGFIRKLNGCVNYEVRLPWEAEWEYACRAGTMWKYAGSGNLDDMGWYDKNSGEETHPVGQKRPNDWGFFDMHGNVWEWCQDWHDSYSDYVVCDPTGSSSGERRVLRGGSCRNGDTSCTSPYRFGSTPSDTGSDFGSWMGFQIDYYYGFRLACSTGPC